MIQKPESTLEELQTENSKLKRDVRYLRVIVACFLIPKAITIRAEIAEEMSKGNYSSLYTLVGIVLLFVAFFAFLGIRARSEK